MDSMDSSRFHGVFFNTFAYELFLFNFFVGSLHEKIKTNYSFIKPWQNILSPNRHYCFYYYRKMYSNKNVFLAVSVTEKMKDLFLIIQNFSILYNYKSNLREDLFHSSLSDL